MRAWEAGLIALLAVQCGGPPQPMVPTPASLVGAPEAQPAQPSRASKIRLCSWNLKRLRHGVTDDFLVSAIQDPASRGCCSTAHSRTSVTSIVRCSGSPTTSSTGLKPTFLNET
jgi:hypothetical protein